MNISKLTILLTFCLFIGSCIKDEPLTNSSDNEVSITNIQNELWNATRGLTPESLLKKEFVYFRYYARLYTTQYQGVGYQTYQVFEKNPSSITLEDGTVVDLSKFNIIETNYDEPTNPSDPPIQQAPIEWKCDYAKDPYNLWLNECDLAPYQNFLLFNNIVDEGQKFFYNLKKYKKIEKLPQKMIDENRCYHFVDCKVEVTYLEFDLITIEDGERRRLHVTSSFTNEFPYLASNPKQCITTLVEVDGQKHPYELCRELINFVPGE